MIVTPQTVTEEIASLQAIRKLTEVQLHRLNVSVLPPELQKGESLNDMNWQSNTMRDVARILGYTTGTMAGLPAHAQTVMDRANAASAK